MRSTSKGTVGTSPLPEEWAGFFDLRVARCRPVAAVASCACGVVGSNTSSLIISSALPSWELNSPESSLLGESSGSASFEEDATPPSSLSCVWSSVLLTIFSSLYFSQVVTINAFKSITSFNRACSSPLLNH